IGPRQVRRRPEVEDEAASEDQQEAVDGGDEDLAYLSGGRVDDREAGQVAELDRLAREGESPRDDGLRRYDRGRRREDDQGIQTPRRSEAVEGILDGGLVAEQQRSLAEVVEE